MGYEKKKIKRKKEEEREGKCGPRVSWREDLMEIKERGDWWARKMRGEGKKKIGKIRKEKKKEKEKK